MNLPFDPSLLPEPRLFRWALPILAGIAIAEAFVFPRLAGRRFPWPEAWASIGVAVVQFLVRATAGGLMIGWFVWLWSVRPWTVPLDTVWGLVALFLMVELVYYWHHRLSHEIRWFWATHAVHHSPNHLNFAAALRLGWTGEISGATLLYSPAVLAGFHPLAVFGMLFVNLLYQFWIHSEYLPRLGPLEGILNTPANHRVHHAANPEYLDRNYGGITVIFDRLFGTHVPETDEVRPRYGLVTPLTSTNPVTIALHEWAAMGRDLVAARTWRGRFMALFGPPGWREDGKGSTTADIRAAAGLDQPRAPAAPVQGSTAGAER